MHLIAIAGRLGVPLGLDDWDRLGRDVPTIVDLMPSGRFLMEDFYYAGGLPVVIKALGEAGLLNRDALTVTGRTIWENVADAENYNERGDPPVRQAADAGRRHHRAPRQPRAARRGAEALGGDAGADAAHRPRRRLRDDRGLSRSGSTIRRSTSTRPASWC